MKFVITHIATNIVKAPKDRFTEFRVFLSIINAPRDKETKAVSKEKT